MGCGTSSSINNIPDGHQLMEETGFSAANLQRLYERFQVLDRGKQGELSPEDFEAVHELAINPIGGRIIEAFLPPGRESVDFATFVRVLAHFRPSDLIPHRGRAQHDAVNSADSKLRFAFKLFDRDRDGLISAEELLQVLRAMLEMKVSEEELQNLAKRAIEEADHDGDGAINFDEFKKSLERINIDHTMSIRFLE